jgi:hypothetical protein
MTIDIGSINGNKTYISIVAYVAYLILVKHNIIQAIPDVELLLKGAIGASFAHKVSKIGAVDTPTAPPPPAV